MLLVQPESDQTTSINDKESQVNEEPQLFCSTSLYKEKAMEFIETQESSGSNNHDMPLTFKTITT